MEQGLPTRPEPQKSQPLDDLNEFLFDSARKLYIGRESADRLMQLNRDLGRTVLDSQVAELLEVANLADKPVAAGLRQNSDFQTGQTVYLNNEVCSRNFIELSVIGSVADFFRSRWATPSEKLAPLEKSDLLWCADQKSTVDRLISPQELGLMSQAELDYYSKAKAKKQIVRSAQSMLFTNSELTFLLARCGVGVQTTEGAVRKLRRHFAVSSSRWSNHHQLRRAKNPDLRQSRTSA